MGFRRVQVLMMLLTLSCGFASSQAAAYGDSAHNASAFFPDVKPYVPASAHTQKAHRAVSKKHPSAAAKSPKIKTFAAVKASSGFEPVSKPFVPDARRHAAKKIHLAPSQHAANGSAANTVKAATSFAEFKNDVENALQENSVNAAVVANVKPQEAVNNKVEPVKADAVVKGRVDERIQARNSKIDVITSAAVGVDPNKIDASKAIHSIFVAQPRKAKPILAEKTVSVQPAKNAVVAAKPDALIGAAAARQAMIDDGEAGKIPVVKVVTADLSKNEFYILGESEPVPEHLKNNPETQMVVLGGEVDDAAKKIREFKLAALNAARVRAARELAERQATAKALAELEIEEKEAMAKLAAAQKAVDDMQKLKKWQKEKESNVGTVVEKVTPEYKKAIVQTVVPEEIHTNAVAEKPEDKLVPISHIALSAEKVADDLGHDGVIPHMNDTVAEVKVAPALKPDAKKVIARKKARPSSERIAEKQINDEIINSKSAKHRKVSRSVIKNNAHTRSRSVAARSEKKVKAVKNTIAPHQEIPVEQAASEAIAPKAMVIDKKQNVSLKQSSRKAAVIKLAKNKKPARP